MFVWILIGVILFALAMVAASCAVIYRYDRERFADHAVRTLTQIAVGATSIVVAFAIFAQQSSQQDARLFAQQALLSATFLRSIIEAVSLEVKYPQA